MSSTSGAALALGLHEGTAYGRFEGFTKAFNAGVAMGPIIYFFGGIGRTTENALFFRKVGDKLVPRKHMPKRFAAAMGGLTESLGWSAMEDHELNALWTFLSTPGEEGGQIYRRKAAGFGVLRGMTRGARVGRGAGEGAGWGGGRAQHPHRAAARRHHGAPPDRGGRISFPPRRGAWAVRRSSLQGG
jgi:hypothetical protein